MMIARAIQEQIRKKFFKGKALLITGARQTGKTTLLHDLVKKADIPPRQVLFFNGDNPTDREMLRGKDFEFLDNLAGKASLICIDEGQKVATIGQTVKLLVDHYKAAKQILVTGSSSMNLLEKTQEALTGRKQVFHLYPLSMEEIYHEPGKKILLKKELEERLIFGSYPEVVTQRGFQDKKELLLELQASYLYKDILEFQKIRNSDVLVKLVRAVAFQIGNLVSENELANLVGIDKKTVGHYLDLLEKSFVLFRVPAYSGNQRREIARAKKIYFYDLGIRNAVIQNFNLLEHRNDQGALWENFAVIERLKYRQYRGMTANTYFWRTYDGSEVDWVEERDGKLFGYECKWKEGVRVNPPPKWREYPQSRFQVITPASMKGVLFD